ncbi:hypothetical protein AKO1_014333 [Acrasis kona]|uniref:Uncharacterized protein n=1 Tax=Acrasis kona TaxID=1008807 RepID=A0AAW2Z0M9_9EUKA
MISHGGIKREVGTPQPQDTWNRFRKYIQERPANLKQPRKFGSLSSEADSGILSEGDVSNDGVSIQAVTVLASDPSKEVQVAYAVGGLGTQAPPRSNLAMQFSHPNGWLSSQVYSNFIVSTIRQRLLKNVSGEVTYVGHQDYFKTALDISSPATKTQYNVEHETQNNQLSLSCVQAVAPGLEVGIKGFAFNNDHDTGVSVKARYSPDDTSVYTASLSHIGSQESKNRTNFRGSFYQKVENDFSVAGRIDYDVDKKSSSYEFGVVREATNAVYKVTADSDYNLKANLTMKFGTATQMEILMDSQPLDHQYKFGFGFVLTS